MMKRKMIVAALLLVPVIHADAEERDEGAALFEARCALCHQLPDPKMLKPGQWDSILTVMELRIAQSGMPRLAQEEVAAIRAYLHKNARPQ